MVKTFGFTCINQQAELKKDACLEQPWYQWCHWDEIFSCFPSLCYFCNLEIQDIFFSFPPENKAFLHYSQTMGV